MPFTVQELIEGHQELITVFPHDKAQYALELMIEHEFSQLPVIDENNKPLGIVTSDSILRALNYLGISLADLQISQAFVKVHPYSLEDDLFEMLDSLKDKYAILIADNEQKLIRVVTSYDTTEYFRRRAQDTMYVEDIETTIKDFIRIAFNADTDNASDNALEIAITDVTGNDIRNKLQNALNHYLNLCDKDNAKINQDFLNAVFLKHFVDKEEKKELDDLTLNEYIQLLLHKSKKTSLTSIFSLKAGAINKLLKEVGKTRNDLMHFRGEISAKQRDQLHFCAQWLESQRSKVLEAFPAKQAELSISQVINIPDAISEKADINTSLVTTTTEVTVVETNELFEEVHAETIPINVAPLDEPVRLDESRYAPLAIWLLQRPLDEEHSMLSFKGIEELIRSELPASARKHRAWWSNYLQSNPQARQWWDAGWRVSYVDMEKELVQFTRIHERENAYNDFFHSLYVMLSQEATFALKAPSIYRHSWITVAQVPGHASFGFAFTYHRRFRVELYIDTGDKEKNKRIFDALYLKKNAIESELEGISGKLEWERIDDKRASRVALYHSGAIADTATTLNKLKTWAVNAMLRFQPVMERHVSEVINDL